MRNFVADSVAMLVFFTITGVFNERFVAGMEWEEVLSARLIGAPLMILSARPYGIWRDLIMGLSNADQPGRGSAFFLDTLASLSFQIPTYAGILWLGGADASEILRGSAGIGILMLISGRPYGLWLDWVRRWCGIQPCSLTLCRSDCR